MCTRYRAAGMDHFVCGRGPATIKAQHAPENRADVAGSYIGRQISDMFASAAMDEITGNRGVIFATRHPSRNSHDQENTTMHAFTFEV